MVPSTKKYETNRLTSIIPSSIVRCLYYFHVGLFLLILEILDRIIGFILIRFFSDDVSIILWKIFVLLLLNEK